MYAPIVVADLKKDPQDPKKQLQNHPPRKDAILKPVIENRFLEKNIGIHPRKR
jgi:hypothetical protein